jgi:hypothetical protein
MKKLITVLFVVSFLLVFLAYDSTFFSTPALAQCPAAEELYCAPLWTPAMQVQKNRVAFLDKRVGEGPWLNLSACDNKCLTNYDTSGLGVLGMLAKKNDLPYDKVVAAYIVTWDKWATQAEKDLHRKLLPRDMDLHYAIGINNFADELRVNHPFVIDPNDETKWCVEQEYGGICSGKW